MSAAEGISIQGLTVQAGGTTLLEEASAEFPANRVTLVVGASGAGKTVLLKLLAGLIRPGEHHVEARGLLRIGGVDILAPAAGAARWRGAPRAPGATGIIFQNFALFDELTAVENLQFAVDHRGRPAPPRGPQGQGEAAAAPPAPPDPRALLAEFDLPARTPVSAMSGGERQRLAIARTLAYDPPVLLFDEPTSGLDPANAARVARRIRATADAHRKTTVVVTHDIEELAPIADAAYLLHAETRKLEPIALQDLAKLAQNFPAGRGFEAGESPAPPRPGLPRRLAAFFERTGRSLELSLWTLLYLFPVWRSRRWGLRYLRHYLGLVASPSAWLYFGAAGVIAGFVATHFVFKFLPHRKFTEPLFADEVLSGLGFALYRILVPVLLTILLAARCGAAVASDVGNRLYGHQVDAMRSLGAPPERYLLTNVLLAFLLATPLLIGLGFLAARYTSLVVFIYNYPDWGPNFWEGHFYCGLRLPGEALYRGTSWLLAKLLIAGVGIGGIAYHAGMRPKRSGVDVSRGITTTVIAATLYVLGVHFAFAFFEF